MPESDLVDIKFEVVTVKAQPLPLRLRIQVWHARHRRRKLEKKFPGLKQVFRQYDEDMDRAFIEGVDSPWHD